VRDAQQISLGYHAVDDRTRPASTPAAEATARIVVRSLPSSAKIWRTAVRMRSSLRRRCCALVGRALGSVTGSFYGC
jgi:hypothetical protein